LIPGDGIGNELADSVKEVFDAIKVPITFDEVDVKGETEGKDEKFLEAMDSLTRNKVGLKGIIYTPPDSTGHNSWNVSAIISMSRRTLMSRSPCVRLWTFTLRSSLPSLCPV
jgi:isocitrate/isopropylmalate dehydrogenase